MLFPLRVRQVRAIVLVDGQAESALEAADVVFEEIGVFVEVDCFQRELAQALATVGVGCGPVGDAAAAELGACSVLESVSTDGNKGLVSLDVSERRCVPGNPWCSVDWGSWRRQICAREIKAVM